MIAAAARFIAYAPNVPFSPRDIHFYGFYPIRRDVSIRQPWQILLTLFFRIIRKPGLKLYYSVNCSQQMANLIK